MDPTMMGGGDYQLMNKNKVREGRKKLVARALGRSLGVTGKRCKETKKGGYPFASPPVHTQHGHQEGSEKTIGRNRGLSSLKTKTKQMEKD